VAARKTRARVRRELIWSDRALRDLQAIDAYIAVDDPVAAARWVDKLLAAAERTAVLPHSGHAVREKGREHLRQVFVRSYRIVYRFDDKRVEVVTVFEGHHLLPDDVK
jgi:plasmid stabilization system protein ParE